ncbi:serine hydrolase [Pontibacter locisalis]|uniref:Serine hydrolase n=1 Tax=Pontibacter locisalis TaxID=1719035 RepID=A0ABW5IL08_9BACT
MKNLFHSIQFKLLSAVSLFLLCLISINAKAQDVASNLTQYIDSHLQQGTFSGTVVVTEKGKPIYSKGFGMADYDKSVANGAETKFRFGSITKSFTAALILQLQEQGKLHVQDKLSKYLPDFPNADKITLHHLLTHTSGLANYTDTWSNVYTQPASAKELINYFKDKPMLFEPGAKFSYCNSGYVLLGHVVEIVTGKTYEQALSKNIFKPLKMTTAGLEGGSKAVRGMAVGYNHNGAKRKLSNPIDMSWCWAAGAIYGTAADLAKWDEGLRGNKILSEESKKLMYAAEKNNYGYGCVIDSLYGELRISYSGAINGFKASFIRFPGKETTIAVLSNYESQQVNGPIVKDVTAIVFGEKYEVPVVRHIVAMPAAKLASYVGEYQVSPKFAFKVTLEEGQLFAEGPGQDKFEIFPEAEDKFFLKVAPALISFEKDEAGKVVKMLMHHGGRTMPAVRAN